MSVGAVVEAVVGVDIGTTETKALVVDTDGRQLGFARGTTTWDGAETTADALFADARELVKKSPAVAIGAAAALGFIVARLVKAGVPETGDTDKTPPNGRAG